MRGCPNNKKSGENSVNKDQYSSIAPPNRYAPIGVTFDNSPHVVTCIIKVFTFDIYTSLDQGAILSFETPYVANQFEILPEKLCEPFCVSTSVGESILAERVYRDYPVFINYKNTMDDLVELNMVDFDVILGMDWLHAYYASID